MRISHVALLENGYIGFMMRRVHVNFVDYMNQYIRCTFHCWIILIFRVTVNKKGQLFHIHLPINSSTKLYIGKVILSEYRQQIDLDFTKLLILIQHIFT